MGWSEDETRPFARLPGNEFGRRFLLEGKVTVAYVCRQQAEALHLLCGFWAVEMHWYLRCPGDILKI